ncbi:hypothetical protein Peur_052116 [Populus x canadensis]
MISAKKLIRLARKWQKLAAIRRKRLTLPQTISSLESDDRSTSSTAEKGHFVVYTTDKKRFVLPLNYLNNEIVRELFNLAEEEFGLTSDGPITLPCDATFMEYAIILIQQNVAKDIEKAFLVFGAFYDFFLTQPPGVPWLGLLAVAPILKLPS